MPLSFTCVLLNSALRSSA